MDETSHGNEGANLGRSGRIWVEVTTLMPRSVDVVRKQGGVLTEHQEMSLCEGGAAGSPFLRHERGD